MKIQPDFKILMGYAYLLPDRIKFSGFSSIEDKPLSKFSLDWSRLYLILLVLFCLSLLAGFCFAFYFGEDLKILGIIAIWCLWVLYRIILRWRFTWVQEIEHQTIQSIEFYKPFYLGSKKIEDFIDPNPIELKSRWGFLRASFIIYYKTGSKFIWKRRIRLRGWGMNAEGPLREAIQILSRQYSGFIKLKNPVA